MILYLRDLVDGQDPDTVVQTIREEYRGQWFGYSVYTRDYDIFGELCDLKDLWVESALRLLNGEYREGNEKVLMFPRPASHELPTQ